MGRSSKRKRRAIFLRDGNRCKYCGNQFNLTLDHVIPKSKGGSSSKDNLVTACRRCNELKGDRDDVEPYVPVSDTSKVSNGASRERFSLG